jgi:hypothetical protein
MELVLSQRVQSFLCSLKEQPKMFLVDRKPAYHIMTLLSCKFMVLILYYVRMKSVATYIKTSQNLRFFYYIFRIHFMKLNTELKKSNPI